MPSPPSASAHMVAAIAAAEHASMQSCIIGISMPVIPAIGMDFIMSAIMLIVGHPPSSLEPGASDVTPRADRHAMFPGRRTATPPRTLGTRPRRTRLYV